jgi:hypothetical protein
MQALKVAPKGISKDHPDIDLLKLRSIAVLKQFVPPSCPSFLLLLYFSSTRAQTVMPRLILSSSNIRHVCRFRDEEVLSPTWQEELLRLVKIALPFVH